MRVLRSFLGVLSLAAMSEALPADPPTQAPAAPAVSVPTYPNTTCPIMGKPASKALIAETEWGRIYVCCPPCIAKIAKDPERAYKAAYPVAKKAGNSVCPVTDKPLGADAVTVTLQGYEIGVCATCAAEARKNHQIVLAKALDPKLVELRNLTCPITGQPVTVNAFCVIGTQLIHLSSAKAVDEVRKDPAGTLKKVQDSVAQQAVPAAPSAPTAPAAPGPATR